MYRVHTNFKYPQTIFFNIFYVDFRPPLALCIDNIEKQQN